VSCIGRAQGFPNSGHGRSDGLAHRDSRGLEVMEAEDIDPEIVWRHPLPVERVDATDLAKEVPGGLRVELVFREGLLAREETEPALMDLDHQRILPVADLAVAHRELGKISLYLEAHGTAVTTSKIFLHRPRVHGRLWG